MVLCATAPEGRFAWKNVALLSTCSSRSHVTAHPCEQAVDGIGQHTNGWHAVAGTSVGEWMKVCTYNNDVMTRKPFPYYWPCVCVCGVGGWGWGGWVGGWGWGGVGGGGRLGLGLFESYRLRSLFPIWFHIDFIFHITQITFSEKCRLSYGRIMQSFKRDHQVRDVKLKFDDGYQIVSISKEI